jgi:uncharacterized NAD-dependent epimerase/dehydratase family protein
MGFGLLRYGVTPVVAVIDRDAPPGTDLERLTGIPQARGVPIVASVRDALAFSPDVLVPAIAPAGGVLPPDWRPDIADGLRAGLSLVNGLHEPLAAHPDVAPLITRSGQWVWDIRQEPPGLVNGSGRARELNARRVLFVGTDMANGKMTAALELDRAARNAGLRSAFVATGQIGIAIAGDGVPLDAVRVDFASGAVEQWVCRYGEDADVVWVEGQGSLLHPASTATLPLLRGAMPTHLILVHRAGQSAIHRAPWVPIPPLPDVVRLYEAVASAAGALSPAARVVGVALNTVGMDDEAARRAVDEAARETGLPVTDVVRFGTRPLLDAVVGH